MSKQKEIILINSWTEDSFLDNYVLLKSATY